MAAAVPASAGAMKSPMDALISVGMAVADCAIGLSTKFRNSITRGEYVKLMSDQQ